AQAAIASTTTLLAAEVSETMLYRHALPKRLSACRCFHQLSQSVLQLFVGSDLDRSSGLDRRHRAMAAQRAASTDFGVKLDDRTRIEVLDLACWAPDRSVPHVDLELGLRKSCAVAADPWLASDRAAASEDILDEHASDVSAIDVERS